MAKPTTGRAAEQAQPAGPLAVGINEACKIVGISRSRFYAEAREGRLTIRKSGRRSVVPMSELHRWLAALPTT